MSKNQSVTSKAEQKRLEARQRARACADDFIRTGRVCFGCAYYALCGIGDRDAANLSSFLRAVDPDGKNITVIGLGPLAPSKESR